MFSSSYACHSPLPEDEGVQGGALVVVRRLPRRIHRDVLGHLLHWSLPTAVVGVHRRCVHAPLSQTYHLFASGQLCFTSRMY